MIQGCSGAFKTFCRQTYGMCMSFWAKQKQLL